MTAVVSSSPSTYLINAANTTGILLNSRSPSSPLHRPPSSFTSSSSSASTSHSRSPSSTEGEGTSRKIRFAPLPAPRRDDLPSVFYESDSDSQLLRPHNDAAPPPPPTPRTSSLSTVHPDDTPAKNKSRTWPQKLLRPLLHPLLPYGNGNGNGDESYSALFRISSRDSTKHAQDAPDDALAGPTLTRRMSTGSRAIPSAKEAERSQIYKDGVPLAPVMSEGSSSRGRKDGQRMLNGRVYGRRLSSVTHNQPSSEPEFVEWGYGGMGSVTSDPAKSRSGPDWAKLQSNGKVLGAGDDIDNEGDDGSGMGWVRKRRAQREQEKREREECEKASQNPATTPETNVQSPDSKESKRSTSHSQDSESKPKDHEEHHIYRAVSIPAPYHHHVRHHHKSSEGSGTVTPTSLPSLSRAGSSNSVPLIRTASSGSSVPLFRSASSGSSVPLIGTPSSGSHGEALPTMPETKEDKEASNASPATSTASIDEDEDDSEDENDTERDSDEEDDSDDAEGRITSKGAGVEKISRHKE